MIGVDTNVIVRYVVQDDPEQSAQAASVIDACSEQDPGFVSLVAVVELHWVLRRAYDVPADRCADVVLGLTAARELVVEQASVVRAAVAASRDGADFADAVIAELGRVAGCAHTVTFDRRAARSPGMQLIGAQG